MKGLNLKQLSVIFVLALLTALEPLSIDLYLPGFVEMAAALKTDTASLQISLSTFLAGFAVGQLFWGPLADKYGRKKPILASLVLFTLASVACSYVTTVEQLWVVRFIQAVGGCAGVVISRAIITDYFEKSQTLKLFGILALIMGVAPIIAPIIGNYVLVHTGWKGLFHSMTFLGILVFFLVLFLLPETQKNKNTHTQEGIVQNYLSILKTPKFAIYATIIGIVNGALMLYVANGPFLIMEKGGFTSGQFSIIFAINSLGLMISSYLPASLEKFFSKEKLISLSVVMMVLSGSLLTIATLLNLNFYIILILLFFYVFPIGFVFPLATDLGMGLFTEENSGSASSLFGAIQLSIAFIFTVLSGFLANGTTQRVSLVFLVCALSALAVSVKMTRTKLSRL